MGGINSKLRKYLEIGDQEMSTKIIVDHSDMLKNFSANEVITEFNETPLLLCCKWSMNSIVKTLLYECNGNPNRKNVFNQTAIHLICQIPFRLRTDPNSETLTETPKPYQTKEEANEKRAECLRIVLDWNRISQTNKNKKVIETIDINALDRNGNTALHLAATHGLIECVKILIENNSELFIENESGDTAIELSSKYCHLEVLKYLEFKMVYSNRFNALLSKNTEYSLKEEYFSMKSSDLEEAKNRLIVETSQMLNISLSTAEVMLRSFDWSQESLIDNWFNESNRPSDENHLNSANIEEIGLKIVENEEPIEKFCEICSLELETDSSISVRCDHHFCYECWKTYLELKIESGETSAISCPAFNCSELVTMKVIEKVVSPEMNSKFLRNDIELFIESNSCIKWCPFPSCSKAVYLSECMLNLSDGQSYILANMPPILPVSHAVECGSGHYFCWECKREAHSPCDCKLWEDWMTKISDIKAEELKQTYSRTEDAANCLWLVRNAKQCPRCKTHIQKSEGCNHLRCTKCKYDFCWVCLESWKKHNSGTGGYFRCNRSEAAQRAEQNICLLKRVAEAQNCEMKELKKFVFHYTKYKFNYISADSEASLIDRSKSKQKELFDYCQHLVRNGETEAIVEEDDDFFVSATIEMIRSRKVLCGSAVYGYYLEDHGYNKAIFEYLENNLNYVCNRLSDIIECDFLKNTRNYIIDLTNKVRNKRLEFLLAIAKGLIPPETPPGLNKHHKRHCLPGVLALDSMENLSNPCDENDNSLINEAIISSLSDYNDKNLWIQDKNGRHNNVFAIYDWPDDCHVDYCDCRADCRDDCRDDYRADTFNDNLCPQTSKTNETDLEICSNLFCTKPKVKNPRTGKKHDFCSLKCKYLTEDKDTFEDNIGMEYEYDSSMDLLLAIEMSKLSYEEERQRQNDSQSLHSNNTSKDEEHNSEENNSDNPFEQFVENIKTNPDSNESSTKTAVMYFLKSSFNEVIEDKNLSQSLNDMKVDKKLFSGI